MITKEKAEFIAKNHITRVEKFEPPFRLRKCQYYDYLSKDGFKMSIYKPCLGKYKYEILFDCMFVQAKFDTYQEAVDYARKDFIKGEE